MNMHIKSHDTVEIYDKHTQKSAKTYSIPLTLVVSEDGIIIESDECAGKFPDCFNSNKDNNHISRLVPFLTKVDLLEKENERVNPYLRFLSRIGHHFEVTGSNDTTFFAELYFSDIIYHKRHLIMIMLYPIRHKNSH